MGREGVMRGPNGKEEGRVGEGGRAVMNKFDMQ